jgi:hypothetical protein
MPRRKHLRTANAFEQVRRQARALVTALRGEIRVKESELKQLKEEEAALNRLGGGGGIPAAGSNGNAPRMRKGPSRRVDWSAILQDLPKQFKAADIRTISAVKSKRPSEIFAAITRWIEAGSVRRKARGVYERA